MKPLKERWINTLRDPKFWTIMVVLLALLVMTFLFESCAYVDKDRAIKYYDQEVQYFPNGE